MANEHRLRIELTIIKQMLEKNEVHTFEWIPSKHQLADCLAKQRASLLNLAKATENGRISSWHFYWHFIQKKPGFVKDINTPENKKGNVNFDI